MNVFKQFVTELYTGDSINSKRFRYGLIAFDFATIVFFVSTAHLPHGPGLIAASMVTGALILADFLARLWISEDRVALLKRVYTIADIIVITTLFLEPVLEGTGNLAFLRVLRGLRLIHSYQLIHDLRQDSTFFRRYEDSVIAAINLFVFVLMTATTVLVFFIDPATTPTPYLDALYFTVATLTTTGYGDITLTTPGGKLFSVIIMVIGVALFVRLAQTIFRPRKVHHTCWSCGLTRHELDAVHCKHCGEVLKIKTSGA